MTHFKEPSDRHEARVDLKTTGIDRQVEVYFAGLKRVGDGEIPETLKSLKKLLRHKTKKIKTLRKLSKQDEYLYKKARKEKKEADNRARARAQLYTSPEKA